MKKQPKVSIVVPIYGVEKYIHDALDSVINQTLKDIEIILVDDGGKDNCPQIIDNYAKKDNRIKVIHKTNGGYGSACNAGLNIATGEYIAIFEPDDFIDLDMYKYLYECAIKNNADVVKSGFNIYLDLPKKTPQNTKIQWFDKKSVYKLPKNTFNIKKHPEFLYFHPSIWTCLYKRDFIEKNNIRVEEIPGAGWTDNLFQVQTLLLAQRIYYTDKHFYHWRVTHSDEASELKDFYIPFLRTKTIHKWMHDNNIKDKNIWACLYKRELAYIHIVSRGASKNKIKSMLDVIDCAIKDIDPSIIYNNDYISQEERKSYKEMCKNFMFFYKKYKISRFIRKVLHLRKSLFSVHYKSFISQHEKEKYLSILGFIFYRGNLKTDIKHFKKIKI